MSNDARRAIPKMDVLLAHPWLVEQVETWGRPVVVTAARRVLEYARLDIGDGHELPSLDDLAQTVAKAIEALRAGRLTSVINATGVVLHTNLGRAPLSAAARAAIEDAAGYSTVEFDLQTGQRGKRGTAVRALVCELTGAPAALVVNNAAAAILLALSGLAKDREVIVSRGQLIEIGGEFRIPSVMEAAGVTLVEVGTTNRTHLSDYRSAITDRTAMLMVVHPSNYRIEGFTAQPPLSSLVELAREHGIPLLHDIGSGLLHGSMGDEPTLEDSLQAGVDLAVFSGDKLLGGPQAGIIVGRADLVTQLSRHPIARAVRIDKLNLAAMEATLLSHLKGRLDDLPVWRALKLTPEDIRPRAETLAALFGSAARLRRGVSVVGGGSLPGEGLPSVLVDIDPAPISEAVAMARLRTADPPVIARTEKGRVVVDLRTVPPEQDQLLGEILLAMLKASDNPT
ncbi:L-seryl-tRNA(Sec) selenium transferase [Nonomuraea polychroma]|uniref:L-seryl-tRNA(Sec) selenium transferase n=1 Tax=Nonomuraea polychroma TaxID=46176 RepID=A0A438M1R1_9ACTN|nr:L-seryl-tRNA(Sec) selenium transferase [Nonomuraea polychroma]RVX39760.1 L-seryl-tRNA(Sec) selenium transferase [Nonomuraea polychroma]